MSCLPKPVLRGYAKKRGIIIIATGLSVSVALGLFLNFFVKRPRKKAYEEFLKTYDPQAHYNDLKKWGYLTSAEFLKNSGQ